MNLENLTPEQVKLYQVIQHIRMAWVVLIVMLAIFVFLIVMVVWAAIDERIDMAVALVLLDGIVGWTIKRIISSLFPHDPTPISN